MQKLGTFCVFECQIGLYNREMVDCISIDMKNIVKCFEIKVTKSDFHSEHGHNFMGNYNYYVMPIELYKQVNKEIPEDIGVLVPKNKTLISVKRAKKMKNKYSKKEIKFYIFRSLYRDFQKNFPKNQQKLLDKYTPL